MDSRIEELLDEVELESPIRDAFMHAINSGRLEDAYNILSNEGICASDVHLLIAYFHNKNKEQLSFVEISVDDLIPDSSSEEIEYLFRYGHNIVRATLFNHRGVWTFYCDHEFVPLSSANQIWRIVPKE